MSPDRYQRSLFMEVLVENLTFLTWQQVLMWLIGGVLIYLAIVKEMEPSLLLPMVRHFLHVGTGILTGI